MNDYFAAHTTQAVTAQSFLDAAGITYKVPDPGEGPAYSLGDIARRLTSAVIVYGTARETGTNRYVAEQLQERYRALTAREREVMALVISGMLNKHIAAKIGASEATVKIHRGHLMEKMQADSLIELVRMADKLDLSPR